MARRDGLIALASLAYQLRVNDRETYSLMPEHFPDIDIRTEFENLLEGGRPPEPLSALFEEAFATHQDASTEERVGGLNRVRSGDYAPQGRTVAELLNDPRSRQTPAIAVPRLLRVGRSTLLSGREKGGKSTLSTAGVAAASAGRSFLGEPVNAASVLWYTIEEDPFDVARRFAEFDVDPNRVRVATAEDLPRGRSDLLDEMRLQRPDIVVIDTLTTLATLSGVTDANDAIQMTGLVQPLTTAAHEIGSAVLILTHTTKDGGDYRGSTAIGATVDMVISMSPFDGDATRRHFVPRGRWRAEPFDVRLTGTHYALVGSAVEESTEMVVIAYVRQHPRCSKRAISEGISKRRDEVFGVVDRLVDSGVLKNEGNARNWKLIVASGAVNLGLVVPDSASRETLGNHNGNRNEHADRSIWSRPEPGRNHFGTTLGTTAVPVLSTHVECGARETGPNGLST